MNIQIKIQTLLLLIVGCIQCMEPEVLTLDSRVIRAFIKVNTENKFYIPGFSRQRDRIILLQQLADQGAHITFSSKDNEIPSWLDKDIDTTQKNLYKFLSFLRYNKNTAPIPAQYTCSGESKKLTHVLCLNNDVLWITTKKTIKNGQQIISDLCKEYAYNSETTHAPQPDQNQNSIDAWHQYLQAIKNEMDTIKPIQQRKSTGATLRDQGILLLSNSLIKELIEITRNNKNLNTATFRTQLKNLKLLKKLAEEKVNITFNNENFTCLYDNLFLFLNYEKNSCQAATYNTSLHSRKGFIATILLNNSLLHMVGSQRLPIKTEKKLTDLLNGYRSPQTEHIDKLLDIVKAEEPYFAPSFAESSGGHGEASDFAKASSDRTKGKPTEPTIEIQEEPQKKLTIEGEIIELNDFELGWIVLNHKENNVVQKLRTLSELHDIRQELKTFINDHI